MQASSPEANILASDTSSPSWESCSSGSDPYLKEGFDADPIPPTVTTFQDSIELVLAAESFLAVVPSKEEAAALDAAGFASCGRDGTLNLFLSTTGRASPTIERLGRRAKCTIFLTTRETSAKELEAVTSTISALRAVGIPARAYSVPKAHSSTVEWLTAAGADRVRLALSAAAERTIGKNKQRELSGGYIPLGLIDNVFVCWSNDFSKIQKLTFAAFTSPGALVALAGEPWLRKSFPRHNEKGQVNGFDAIAAGGNLRDQCAKLDSWDGERIRLAGVWKENGKYVVNSSEAYYVEDGAPVARTGARIYASGKDLGINPDVEQATVSDGQDVLDFLHTFNWTRRAMSRGPFSKDTDPLMFMGALFLMYLCAALPQRPHTFIQAEHGSGKSVLLTFAKLMLGGAVVSSSGSSGSGLSSELKRLKACVASILDESGYDSRHIETVMGYLKQAYDGAKKQLGTGDLAGAEFDIRTICLLVGTVRPTMGSQVESRTNLLQMNPWPAGERPPVHQFFTDGDDGENAVVSDLGKRMFARVLHSAPRFERAVAALKAIAMRDDIDGRTANTIVPAMAGSFCMLHDQEMTPEMAAAWFERFDISRELARVKATPIGQEVMNLLATTTVDTNVVPGKTIPMLLSELWHRAALDSPRGDWRQELGMHGMRVDRQADGSYTLGIAAGARGFAKLFAGTKWAKADLQSTIERIDGCSPTKAKGSFAGGSETYNTFPWALPLDDDGQPFEPKKLSSRK